MASLAEFSDRDAPRADFRHPVHHPTERTSVIGFTGFEWTRGESVAVFTRDPQEHFFRKYDGYAVSVPILEAIFDRGVKTVYIEETTDKGQVFEFDIASFSDAPLIAYSPQSDTIVEGEQAIKQSRGEFHDHQRVVAIEMARRTWAVGEVSFER